MIVFADGIQAKAAAANPFLASDKMVNFAALVSLGKKLQKYVFEVKPDGTFYAKKEIIRAKASAKPEDFKYWSARAVKIGARKTWPKAGADASWVLALPTFPINAATRKVIPADLLSQLKLAATAIRTHNATAERVKARVAKDRADIRDEENKAFGQHAETLKASLLEAGFKDNQLVDGIAGGFGGGSPVVFVKLGKGAVVKVTKSNEKEMRDSVARLKETTE